MIIIPNLLTALNFLTGTFALYITVSDKNIVAACTLVLVCGVLDGLDGAAARWLGKESAFGKLFDSCADFVSFGIAPTFIFLNLESSRTPLVILAAAIYLFSSFYRLVRFHHLTEEDSLDSKNSFLGLPITGSACFLVSFVLLFNRNVNAVHETSAIIVLLILSLLMASRIRFPRLQKQR